MIGYGIDTNYHQRFRGAKPTSKWGTGKGFTLSQSSRVRLLLSPLEAEQPKYTDSTVLEAGMAEDLYLYLYRMGYRPGAADPPSGGWHGGLREVEPLQYIYI